MARLAKLVDGRDGAIRLSLWTDGENGWAAALAGCSPRPEFGDGECLEGALCDLLDKVEGRS